MSISDQELYETVKHTVAEMDVTSPEEERARAMWLGYFLAYQDDEHPSEEELNDANLAILEQNFVNVLEDY